MHVLVVADGSVPDVAALDDAWPGWSAGIARVIAADGGARAAERIGWPPDLIVGDGDSLGPADLARFGAAGTEIRLVPGEKDESDAELAVLAALADGATSLTILGALGGRRFDHAVANLGLLALADLGDRPTQILDAGDRVTLVRAPAPSGAPVRRPLPGRPGDLVSLFPFGGDVRGVLTEGLAYPLNDEPLPIGPARGLSNVRLGPDAAVTVRAGRLLVVESPATLRP
jgi:thiamine pyrophosphokinase